MSISGNCPAVTLVVGTATVVASAATDFQKGSCNSIKEGSELHVQGMQQAPGVIIASVVSRK
jgi:hypothetical protein